MNATYPSFGLKGLCGLLGITRQAVYYKRKTEQRKTLVESQVVRMVKAIRKVHPRMGGRKLYYILKPDFNRQGFKIGRDRLLEILSDNQLLIRRVRRKVSTTNSYHRFKKYDNLIKDFTPYRSNQVWVSDITYIKARGRFYYLFLVTDSYSHRVMGYDLAHTLEVKHAVKSIKMAFKKCKEISGLIHHSDRGIQYCSREYVKLLQDYEVLISMTQDSNPTDNAIAERLNGILKQEYLYDVQNETYKQVKQKVDLAIFKYNELRPHLSCNMRTPNKAYYNMGLMNKQWKNYYNYKSN